MVLYWEITAHPVDSKGLAGLMQLGPVIFGHKSFVRLHLID